MNRRRIFVLFCVTLPLLGCGGKELPRGPVKGRVTLGGAPVPGVTVTYQNKAVGVAQTATTDDDGKYEFITYNSSGLPAASYKVTISNGTFMKPGEEIPRIDPKKALPPPPKPTIAVPGKYAKAESSGFSADVQANTNPPFDFDMKPER